MMSTFIPFLFANSVPVSCDKMVVVNKSHIAIFCINIFLYYVGCWTPHMLEPLGVKIPQIQFKHSYVITDSIEGMKGAPCVRDPKHGFYIRPQGDAVQIGSFESGAPILDERVSAIVINQTVLYCFVPVLYAPFVKKIWDTTEA